MASPDYSLILQRTLTAYAWIADGRFTWANRAFLALAGAADQSPEELAQEANKAGQTLFAAESTWRLLRHEAPEGLLIELIPLVGTPHAGSVDSLTGLLNREAIDAELERRFTNRRETPFALVFADLDGFKEINDRRGHLVGDRCLEVIGERLRQSVRADDAVGRYGGDEFLILLHGVQGATALQPVRERLETAVSQPIEEGDRPVRLGLSLGASFSCGSHSTPQEMIAAADRAMYADKRTKPSPPTDVADSARLG